MPMDIACHAAVVTGGASGLGGCAAARLAQRGARVTILDIHEESGRAHAAAIGGQFVNTDVRSETEVAHALDEAERAHGVTRILVNCAGIAPSLKLIDELGRPHPLDAFRHTIEVNLVGTFNLIAQMAARLSKADPVGEERGVIINTASIAGFDGQASQAAYAASKAGVIGMTLPLARDLAEYRIRVMAIAPGIFWSSMLRALPQAVIDSLGPQVPHPSRLGKPEEFAQLVESIVINPMLNGEVIRIDGTLRLGPGNSRDIS
jgi:NAD(P)-dependent dehydrogenase (short-subunit alcohol dehydrogenase family)